MHQYVHYNSCHPKPCKNSIPHSQAKRYIRICSNDNDFKESMNELQHLFITRNYPKDIVDKAFINIRNISQNNAFIKNNRDNHNVIPFVIEYNPSLPHIGNII